MTGISVLAFSTSENPLRALKCRQRIHLLQYLKDLGAETVVVEPEYFDRDYLAEFSAFYGVSAKQYPNTCARLHFFSSAFTTRELLLTAGGDQEWTEKLQQSYLGFSILRPVPYCELGRTVLQWYPDLTPTLPRRTDPSRVYRAHFLGLELSVEGLAWQQQDTRVASCATTALWSLLQSSALDEFHAVPSTVAITQAAHRTASYGARVFPSAGLTPEQICESIKECGLGPELFRGEVRMGDFSRQRFSTICASLIRSGYPCVLVGNLEGGVMPAHASHAMTCNGFREIGAWSVPAETVKFLDEQIEYLYIHDDNIGPSVRFRIMLDESDSEVALAHSSGVREVAASVVLRPSRPEYLGEQRDVEHPAKRFTCFRPEVVIAALPEGIRTSISQLLFLGHEEAEALLLDVNAIRRQKNRPAWGFGISAQFMNTAKYTGELLANQLSEDSPRLSTLRWSLAKDVPRMSQFLGVIRISLFGAPALDLLCDTTDSDHRLSIFATVLFHRGLGNLVLRLIKNDRLELGAVIRAYPTETNPATQL